MSSAAYHDHDYEWETEVSLTDQQLDDASAESHEFGQPLEAA